MDLTDFQRAATLRRIVALRVWIALAGFALVLAAVPSARANSPACIARASPPKVGIELVKSEPIDPRTTVYTFHSAAVPSQELRARVVVPAGYLTHSRRRFPVVYHLHGTGNNALTWDLGDVEKYVLGTTPVILVMPDSGKTDFYADAFGTPVGSPGAVPPAWETWQNRELVPWIDQHLRTNGRRGIAGSSMGGFGSVSYAERFPKLYSAVASLSGAVDIETPAAQALIPTAYGACIFGDPVLDADVWHAENPTEHVDTLRGKSLYVQVGNGLPGQYDTSYAPTAPVLEGLIHDMTINFLTALEAADIPVTARLYGNGTHPDGVGPTRFYDFDGLRLFLAQAMPTLSCPLERVRSYRLPRAAKRVHLKVDGRRHAFRRHGRKVTLRLANTAAARHRVVITARVGSRSVTKRKSIKTCG